MSSVTMIGRWIILPAVVCVLGWTVTYTVQTQASHYERTWALVRTRAQYGLGTSPTLLDCFTDVCRIPHDVVRHAAHGKLQRKYHT